MGDMLDVHALRPGDLDRLAPSEKDALLLQMFNHIGEQSKTLQAHQEQIEQRDKALKFKDASCSQHARCERLTKVCVRAPHAAGSAPERLTAR